MNIIIGTFLAIALSITILGCSGGSEGDSSKHEQVSVEEQAQAERISQAYDEINSFLALNTKCCDQVGIFPNSSFLYSRTPTATAIRAIDLQRTMAFPSDYDGFSVKLICSGSECMNQANWTARGELTGVTKVYDPEGWAMYIVFKDRPSRDHALKMFKSIPDGKGTDPKAIYDSYGQVSDTNRGQRSYSDRKEIPNTYQVVRTERNNLNNQISTKYISCSQGGIETVTVNESIGYYADSEGSRHSNFHSAASSSCN